MGCVSGRLILNQSSGGVAQSQGLYWNFEIALRRMESRIGALHTASGPVMAFRRQLFKPFAPKYGDDCIIPLDIVNVKPPKRRNSIAIIKPYRNAANWLVQL